MVFYFFCFGGFFSLWLRWIHAQFPCFISLLHSGHFPMLCMQKRQISCSVYAKIYNGSDQILYIKNIIIISAEKLCSVLEPSCVFASKHFPCWRKYCFLYQTYYIPGTTQYSCIFVNILRQNGFMVPAPWSFI